MLPHVTYCQPIQRQSPYPLLGNRRDQKNDIFGSVVKLSIVRGRTSTNWPSNSRVLQAEIFGCFKSSNIIWRHFNVQSIGIQIDDNQLTELRLLAQRLNIIPKVKVDYSYVRG
jgi:hypothetical protein